MVREMGGARVVSESIWLGIGYLTAVSTWTRDETPYTAQRIITQAQAQDAGCSLSVCRLVGLRYRPILVGAFCRRSTGFVGSALSRLRSRSRYARLGECT
jgi:hypothetical protein